jgi:hypothetical protein
VPPSVRNRPHQERSATWLFFRRLSTYGQPDLQTEEQQRLEQLPAPLPAMSGRADRVVTTTLYCSVSLSCPIQALAAPWLVETQAKRQPDCQLVNASRPCHKLPDNDNTVRQHHHRRRTRSALTCLVPLRSLCCKAARRALLRKSRLSCLSLSALSLPSLGGAVCESFLFTVSGPQNVRSDDQRRWGQLACKFLISCVSVRAQSAV